MKYKRLLYSIAFIVTEMALPIQFDEIHTKVYIWFPNGKYEFIQTYVKNGNGSEMIVW